MITFKFGLERPEGCDCPNYSAFAISSYACNLLGYLDELPCLKDVTESFHIHFANLDGIGTLAGGLNSIPSSMT